MKRVVVLANDWVGAEVCKFLISESDKIVRLYLHGEDNQKMTQEIVKESNCDSSQIFAANQINSKEHVEGLHDLNIDYIITVYWAHLLKKQVLDCAKEGTINFHPALLPINRGWYPNVYSILEGSPAGVTLHQLAEKADTGPIWAQKEVFVDECDTSDVLYEKLQKEIVELFKDAWPKIKTGVISPIPQDESRASYRSKLEINKYDGINLNSIVKVEDFLRLLKARSFKNKGFAYYIKDGKKIYLNLRIGYNIIFDN